jgi:hypothetical protein
MLPCGSPGALEQGSVLMKRQKWDVNQKSIDDIQTFIQTFSNIEQGVLVEIYRKQDFKYFSIGSSSLGIPKAF